MALKLKQIVEDFAKGIKKSDGLKPIAINIRSKKPFRPGIGPHSEKQTITLVKEQLEEINPKIYERFCGEGIPYPFDSKKQCDICFGYEPDWEWAIEVKMLRFLGDNGKDNDNILMHILSPYSAHRSALTDCKKLINSGFNAKKGILIYGYGSDRWPLEPAIETFEILASNIVNLSNCEISEFNELTHPIHRSGKVFGWEIK